MKFQLFPKWKQLPLKERSNYFHFGNSSTRILELFHTNKPLKKLTLNLKNLELNKIINTFLIWIRKFKKKRRNDYELSKLSRRI